MKKLTLIMLLVPMTSFAVCTVPLRTGNSAIDQQGQNMYMQCVQQEQQMREQMERMETQRKKQQEIEDDMQRQKRQMEQMQRNMRD